MTVSVVYANGGGLVAEVTDVKVLTRDEFLIKNKDADLASFVESCNESNKVVSFTSTNNCIKDELILTDGTKLYVMNEMGNTIASYAG